MSKQSKLRSVHMWQDAYNKIIHRFTDYLRSSRKADGTVQDIQYPLKRLVIESKLSTSVIIADVKKW